MIFAGKLKEKLKFYKIVEIQTNSGFKKTEEVYMFTVNAERTKNKENFVVDAEEIFHNVWLTFRIRYRKEIDETNIVIYKDNRYRITSINPWETDGEMTIMLEKINE
jgi:SPP1 family predicted phage head-tail adaptor